MTQPIRITRATQKKSKPRDNELGFGTVFTDHMFVADFQDEKGWYDPRIEPYGPIPLDPAAAVLHYAQAIFDGLKAFRGKDGRVRLFRPQKHVERMNMSARPAVHPRARPGARPPVAGGAGAPRAGVGAASVGTALYIRPTVIASEPFLGVRPAKQYLYFVILSPVGAYYKEGMNPVKIRVEDKYVRAVEGGIGRRQDRRQLRREPAGGGGGPRIRLHPGAVAGRRPAKYVDEVGTMNIMMRIGDEVLTPPLSTSTILPGVTRDSVLTLLREWGVRVSERPIAIDEVIQAAHQGTLREVWGTGTAAVISPVGELAYKGERLVIGGGKIGELTQKLYDAIVDIQYARVPDTRGWTVAI